VTVIIELVSVNLPSAAPGVLQQAPMPADCPRRRCKLQPLLAGALYPQLHPLWAQGALRC
jgi:hypothetical protein